MRRLFGALLIQALVIITSESLSAQIIAPRDFGTTVNGFQDDFERMSATWVVAGASVYSVSSGVLHVGQANGDPNHLLCTAATSTVQEILARIRVTRFGNGPYARGGIGVCVDPSTGQGINFTFRDNDEAGQPGRHLALLDDYREWGPVLNFAWQTNT